MKTLFLSDVNFKEIINQKEIALIDFYASWCGPCKMLAPILDEIAKEFPNITVGKVNIDFEQIVSKEYNVWTIPTMIIFKNGKEIKRIMGFKPKKELVEVLIECLK